MTRASNAAKDERSPLLRLVLDLERTIGRPIEEFVRSDTYFDLVTEANRARARANAVFERVSTEWLHLLNLPTNSDVRRLREQLSRLERQVNRLAKDLADAQEEADLPPKRGRKRERGSGPDAA